jgi:transcription elongation factor GreA
MTDPSPSLTEAVTKFVAGRKNAKKGIEGHQELGKFVAWCGRDRTVARLSPSEVAEYAQHIGRGGVDAAQKLSPVKAFLTFLKQEGWIETSLAAHLRIPRGRRSAAGSGNASLDSAGGSQLSQEGYDRLVSQLDVLKVERVAVVADIKLAMEDKDFRENAPLDAAKERQGIIEARVRELEASLASAQILAKRPSAPQKKTAVGTKVKLKDIESGKRFVYTLVDVREADAGAGRISTTSPVGMGLINHSVGDEIKIDVPRGKLHYIIEGVET